jgi:hypothetical protein
VVPDIQVRCIEVVFDSTSRHAGKSNELAVILFDCIFMDK